MSDFPKKLRSYPSSTCKDADIYAAADRIEELEADFHKQADMTGRLLTENAELRQRIAELEEALKLFTKLGDNFSDSEVMGRIRTASKVLGEKK